MDYKTTRSEYFKSIMGGFNVDLAHTTFIKKNELKKTIRGLVGGSRTIIKYALNPEFWVNPDKILKLEEE